MSTSPATIASGVLTVACLAAAVKCHMDCKRAIEAGDEPSKSQVRTKKALMAGTVLFACVFAYQMISKRSASSSFLPTSSMAHTESEAEFARRVSDATRKLRQQINQSKADKRLMAPSKPSLSKRGPSPSELAAKASAEISSFIANSM